VKLPDRDIVLAGGKLVCPAYPVPRDNWQAHLVKHPIGLRGIVSNPRATDWNREKWDEVAPPVITPAQRTSILGCMRAPSFGGTGCALPEINGTRGRTDLTAMACYDRTFCPGSLIASCETLLNPTTGLGDRYADVAKEMLDRLTDPDAVEVNRSDLNDVFSGICRRATSLADLTNVLVLSVGTPLAFGAPVASISRGDGVRAEFYVRGKDKHLRDKLVWRTTYRVPDATVNPMARLSFLWEALPPITTGKLKPLSEIRIVPRPWWVRETQQP
jgi:hypothetical protein